MNKDKIYTFTYQGWNNEGQLVRAVVHAQHALMAKNHLALRGILIKRLDKKLFSQPLFLRAKELLLFTQQLALLINASLPLVFCLHAISKQFKSDLQILFTQMIFFIEQGYRFSAVLNHFAPLFPPYFIHLIQVGEQSGQLGTVLSQLATYQEKILQRAAQFKKALLYPVFVLLTSLIITLALLLWIVPQFQVLFTDVSAQLPLLTRGVFYLSSQLQQLQPLFCLLLLFTLSSLFYGLKNNNHWLQTRQWFIFYLPLVGKMVHIQQQIRYLRALGLALQAGLPLMNGLQLAAKVIQSTHLARRIAFIPEQVQSGVQLTQSMQQTQQFNDIVIQLIALGEQTGQLPLLMMQAADINEQDLEQRLEHMTRLMQPILVIILGIILGGLIIALYMPVFQLGTLY